MTKTTVILIASYLILLVQVIASLVWDILHADPLHSQFPLTFRLLLTIPPSLAVLGVIELLLGGRFYK
jgi:hypothetical protein